MSGSPTGHVDAATLGELREALDDDEMFTDVVESFLDETLGQVRSLVAAAVAGDESTVLSMAHLIKGGAMTLGADRLVRLCEAIEAAPASASSSEEELSAELDAVSRELRAAFPDPA